MTNGKKGSLLVLALVPLLVGHTWLMLHWSFSDGERAGYVQKLSKKGWICKTFEGELTLVTLPGSVAEKFLFTVPDPAVAERINTTLGKKVALVYEQHRGILGTCFGDTGYFITDIKPL